MTAATPAEPCNVARALRAQAQAQPDAPAIHYPTGVRRGLVRYQSASYAELDALSDTYARGLQDYGIKRGTRVALMVPPGLDFFALFFALFKAGTVPVLIDPGMGLKPLKKCLAEAAPEAFIGISKAQLARVLLGWARGSIRRVVTVGPRLGWRGISLKQLAARGASGPPPLADTQGEDMAALLFTSGSTGIPKGVVYRHRHFEAQVTLLQERFSIQAGEVDLATFPPFALFDPALGMTTVVPKMDPTRPARANPAYLQQAIEQFSVTNLFGSPALLKNLSLHAQRRQLRFPTLRRALSAGAAVPGETVQRMQQAMGKDGLVHTPYGATECLPVASLSSAELTDELLARTRAGAGTCVGMPLAANRVRIVPIDDDVLERIDAVPQLAPGEIGEIVVHGPTSTDSYWRRDEQTRLAKSYDDEGRCWHRMGDAGYLDEHGRLWFCGRKSQRVVSTGGTLYADQVEAIFNAHAAVERAALVGLGERPQQEPVLIIERAKGSTLSRAELRAELLAMAAQHETLGALRQVLFHRRFPVDIRHNSKIGREALASWAARSLP